MEQDEILEIGIDEDERLYIKPSSNSFPYIYREAMEVHWDTKGMFLYSPKPRKWSYLDWYGQIIKAAKEQSCSLVLSDKTVWVNMPASLKNEILAQQHAVNT
ncbi:MAG: hypothetical protein WBS20_02540 [Lysobacterales bacterium]